jgi:hypothetical protein
MKKLLLTILFLFSISLTYSDTSSQNNPRKKKPAGIAEVSIFPNPSNGQLNVTFNSGSETQVTLKISDMIGKVVMQKVLNANNGANEFSFDLLEIEKGIYFLELTGNSQRIIQRLMLDK